MNDVFLAGISGRRYAFKYYEPNTIWHDLPGIYAMVRRQIPNLLRPNHFEPVYIGRTVSFADRLPSHENWTRARALGATGYLAMVMHGPEQGRAAVEIDLIRAFNPPINKQHAA